MIPRGNRPLIALSALVLGAAAGGVPALAAGTPRATTAALCGEVRNVPDPGNPQHFVYYNPVPGAKGAGCATRIAVENAFESCRLKHGLRGRCTTKVSGFKCKEVGPRQANGSIYFAAKVSCARGSAKFSYIYSQN